MLSRPTSRWSRGQGRMSTIAYQWCFAPWWVMPSTSRSTAAPGRRPRPAQNALRRSRWSTGTAPAEPRRTHGGRRRRVTSRVTGRPAVRVSVAERGDGEVIHHVHRLSSLHGAHGTRPVAASSANDWHRPRRPVIPPIGRPSPVAHHHGDRRTRYRLRWLGPSSHCSPSRGRPAGPAAARHRGRAGLDGPLRARRA